jgi:hypothetical protein
LALPLIFLLGGCAVTDTFKGWLSSSPAEPAPKAVVAQTSAAPTPTDPARKRPVKKAREDKEPVVVASLDPGKLIGLDPPAVEKLLGAPKEKGESDPSLVWTYAGSGCSFQVFFFPDLKAGVFHALKYGALGTDGALIDAAQPCVRNILAGKANAPG